MLYYNEELRGVLNRIWNAALIRHSYDELEAIIDDLDVRKVGNLVTYMATVWLSITNVMKPVDMGFTIPPEYVPKIEGYIKSHLLDEDGRHDEAIDMAVNIYRLLSECKYSELGEYVFEAHTSTYPALVDTIGILSYMLYTDANKSMHSHRALLLRSSHLRATIVDARLQLMEAPWCGSCLSRAHGVMAVLDDRNVREPMDGSVASPNDLSFLKGTDLWEEP